MYYCPGTAALVIIVVACPPWRITPLYHIPMGIFDYVLDCVTVILMLKQPGRTYGTQMQWCLLMATKR